MTAPLRAMARRIAEHEMRRMGLPLDAATGLTLATLEQSYLALARELAGMPETLVAAREAQRGHLAGLAEEHA